jgi:hypothetical protein
MAVPPRPGTESPPSFEHDPRGEPSSRVPRPLPDRGRRAGTTAAAMIVAVLIVIALIVLL